MAERMRSAAGVAVFATFLTVLATACGSSDPPAADPEAPSSPAAAGNAYRSTVFRPVIGLRMRHGWEVAGDDASSLALRNGDLEFLILSFSRITRVADPTDLGRAMRAPDDLVAWLEGHPYLDADPATAVSVGGLEGMQIDVAPTVGPDERLPGTEEPGTVPLFYAGDEPAWIGAFDRYRFIALEVDGEPLHVVLASGAREFDQAAFMAQAVLDTVTFGDA
jgi:hypothetical protein